MTLGNGPTISKFHWANDQGLANRFRVPPGWCMMGTYLWH